MVGPDWLFSHGVVSGMTVPVGYRRQRLGTINLSIDAGWFRYQDVAAGRLIASLLVPALLVD